ncbi:flagellar brake domain-containing protein [Caldibacillus lycopersici]|uniref:Flagellar brake domain-containing protein n=1 Tax=Perspicuibacillus lycopersici TaxID=1325689 RepID=A0AAE3IX88_9BACI|nr:flagellar brake domain-containing protein [Perspicuibacillus lycopersici]MCU9613725.1 flagellar brake domain-containing protein [Perspicuibacillus lycopersici]
MFKIGYVLTIQKINSTKNERFKSKIMDITEQEIYINYPVSMETNKTSYLINGTPLSLSFVGENDIVYQFTTHVAGRVHDGIPLLLIKKPDPAEITKIQRREFVRVARAVDVAIYPMEGDMQLFQSITEDISAGGASIIVPKEKQIYERQPLTCWFVLPRASGKYHYLKFICKVVRISSRDDKSNIISVQFMDKTNAKELQIIQFCYEAELAIKQKELGY